MTRLNICKTSLDLKKKLLKNIRWKRKWSDLSNDGNKPVLRLLTKANCTLCEDSKHKIFSAPGLYEKRLVLKEVNILKQGNEELFDLYRYEIPVFFLGKIFISKNKIDLDKLEQW